MSSSYSNFFSKNTCELDIVLTRTVNNLTTNKLALNNWAQVVSSDLLNALTVLDIALFPAKICWYIFSQHSFMVLIEVLLMSTMLKLFVLTALNIALFPARICGYFCLKNYIFWYTQNAHCGVLRSTLIVAQTDLSHHCLFYTTDPISYGMHMLNFFAFLDIF